MDALFCAFVNSSPGVTCQRGPDFVSFAGHEGPGCCLLMPERSWSLVRKETVSHRKSSLEPFKSFQHISYAEIVWDFCFDFFFVLFFPSPFLCMLRQVSNLLLWVLPPLSLFSNCPRWSFKNWEELARSTIQCPAFRHFNAFLCPVSLGKSPILSGPKINISW